MSGRPERRSALLIGVGNYKDTRIPPLCSPRADLNALRGILKDPRVGGFEAVTEVASDPTADEVRGAIMGFLSKMGSDELALVYFTGHGVRAEVSGEFFFVAHDTDRDHIEDTAVSATFFNEALEECRASQKIALIDCCLSGSLLVGFRTREAKGAPGSPRDPPDTAAPLTARGVYVLSSSRAGETSYGGTHGPDGPTASLFTAAIVDAVRTGQADRDGDGEISVDELFDHVNARLRAREHRSRQVPVKSAIGVDGRLVLATSPLGRSSLGVPVRSAAPTHRPEGVPSSDTSRDVWLRLLDYYRRCIAAESDPPLLTETAVGDYSPLGGEERLLSGLLPEEKWIPVPAEAAALVERLREKDAELLAGYPVIVLLPDKPRQAPEFAPLLIRSVEIVEDDAGMTRLAPYGTVRVNPTLARHFLGEEEVSELTAGYEPTWPPGNHHRMAVDILHLLDMDFNVAPLGRLVPENLDVRINFRPQSVGAQNAAVLFRAPTRGPSTSLLKDLDEIADNRVKTKRTALAALFGEAGTPESHSRPAPAIVTPWRANASQQAVLRAAMTQHLTVATGPPGTGKSQLIANVVATAVAARQKVLVASTNNRAVDEVWERCERAVPGLLIRTGSRSRDEDKRDYREEEKRSLLGLLRPVPAETNISTAEAELELAVEGQEAALRALDKVARTEQELLDATRTAVLIADQLGASLSVLSECLGAQQDLGAWQLSARSAADAWWFGRWRRTRLIRGLGLELNADPESCRALAELAGIELHLRKLRATDAARKSDDQLAADLNKAYEDVVAASTLLASSIVRDSARAGAEQITKLRAAGSGESDWGLLRGVLPHARGWAVTSLSARRFPPGPDLFDLVVVDEASQCSVPAVLPLLFRAKRALIIGDAKQLAHIAEIRREDEAGIRAFSKMNPDWLEERRLRYRDDSAFHAFGRAFGRSPRVLDEHYRCHPAIAAIASDLFYDRTLRPLTDVSRLRVAVGMAPVDWRHVDGKAARPASGRSWINEAEARCVDNCIEQLLEHLPNGATIGVVTPFKAQQAELEKRWRTREPDRVKVGTVHTFQGGERDAMIFSLVATKGMTSRAIHWLEHDPNLWNVAITRARAHLLIVGDRRHWLQRGGIGRELLAAVDNGDRIKEPSRDDDLPRKLFRVLRQEGGAEVQLEVVVDGYRADARSVTGTGTTVFLLDRGHGEANPARHLEFQLARIRLVRDPQARRNAVRVPAWKLEENG